MPFLAKLAYRLGPRIIGSVVVDVVPGTHKKMRFLFQDCIQSRVAEIFVRAIIGRRQHGVIFQLVLLQVDPVIAVKLGVVHPGHNNKPNGLRLLDSRQGSESGGWSFPKGFTGTPDTGDTDVVRSRLQVLKTDSRNAIIPVRRRCHSHLNGIAIFVLQLECHKTLDSG